MGISIQKFFKWVLRGFRNVRYGKPTEDVYIWRQPIKSIKSLSKSTQRKYKQVMVTMNEPSFEILKETAWFYLIRKYDNSHGWIYRDYVEITDGKDLYDFLQKNNNQ